jgi:hypothetical protein
VVDHETNSHPDEAVAQFLAVMKKVNLFAILVFLSIEKGGRSRKV